MTVLAMPPLLVTGARGTLGRRVLAECQARAIRTAAVSHTDVDLSDAYTVARMLDQQEPWAVLNAAGYVRVDDAEHEPEICHHANVTIPAVLASACRETGIPLVTFSSDLVFDGDCDEAYHEADEPAPLSEYGRSKHEAEGRVLDEHPAALVIRTSTFFDDDNANIATQAVRTMQAHQSYRAPSDVIVSPTYVPDLVRECLDLLIDGESGIWHLTNVGQLSWAAFAELAGRSAGMDPMVEEVTAIEMPWRAPRPRNSALTSRRGVVLPSLEDAVARWGNAFRAKECAG